MPSELEDVAFEPAFVFMKVGRRVGPPTVVKIEQPCLQFYADGARFDGDRRKMFQESGSSGSPASSGSSRNQPATCSEQNACAVRTVLVKHPWSHVALMSSNSLRCLTAEADHALGGEQFGELDEAFCASLVVALVDIGDELGRCVLSMSPHSG